MSMENIESKNDDKAVISTVTATSATDLGEGPKGLRSKLDNPGKSIYIYGAILALLLICFGWLINDRFGSGSSSTTTSTSGLTATPFGPSVITPSAFSSIKQNAGHVFYWAGEQVGKKYEVTVLKDSSVFVRYLPEEEQAGSKKKFMTIATYYDTLAYAKLAASAGKGGGVSAQYQGGAFAYEESPNATSAYFAFENFPLQIEVYSPIPGEAWNLIKSGEITPP